MIEYKTLAQLTERIEGNIISEFSLKSPVLRNSAVKILARVIAGGVWLLQGLARWVSHQPFAQTADIENLEQIGFPIGIDRKAATFSRGNVRFTGVDGAIIPQGTIVSRVSDNYSYQTTQEVEIVSGNADVLVVAVEIADVQSAGEVGNALNGTILELTNSVTGVDSECSAITDISGGVDEESVEDYRNRVLYARRNPVHPGSVSYYKLYATSRAGVTDAFVRSNYPTVSSVSISIGDYTNIDDPTVTQAVIDDVSNYLNDASRAQVAAEVYVESVIRSVVDLRLSIFPYTSEIIADCNNKLRNLFRIDGTPKDTYIQNESPANIITISRIESELSSVPNLQRVSVVSIKQDTAEVTELTTDYRKTLVLGAAQYSQG